MTEIDEDGLELNVIVVLGSMITNDFTMDQHKMDFSILLSELHAEDLYY